MSSRKNNNSQTHSKTAVLGKDILIYQFFKVSAGLLRVFVFYFTSATCHFAVKLLSQTVPHLPPLFYCCLQRRAGIWSIMGLAELSSPFAVFKKTFTFNAHTKARKLLRNREAHARRKGNCFVHVHPSQHCRVTSPNGWYHCSKPGWIKSFRLVALDARPPEHETIPS